VCGKPRGGYSGFELRPSSSIVLVLRHLPFVLRQSDIDRNERPSIFLGWCFRSAVVPILLLGWRVFYAERVAADRARYLGFRITPAFWIPPLVGAGVRRGNQFSCPVRACSASLVGWVLRKWNSVPGTARAEALRTATNFGPAPCGGAIILVPVMHAHKDGVAAGTISLVLTVINQCRPLVPVRVCGTFDALRRHIPLPRPTGSHVKSFNPSGSEQLRPKPRFLQASPTAYFTSNRRTRSWRPSQKLEPFTRQSEFSLSGNIL